MHALLNDNVVIMYSGISLQYSGERGSFPIQGHMILVVYIPIINQVNIFGFLLNNVAFMDSKYIFVILGTDILQVFIGTLDMYLPSDRSACPKYLG